MEIKIDIATILKDTPKNTKLYSPIFGDVYFLSVEYGIIKVTHRGKLVIFFGDGRYYNYPESEPLLFPSKEMHNWEKFSWKKGDVLVMDGFRVVFDKWVGDDYTRFNAVHLITSSGVYFNKPSQNRYSPISHFITKYWRKMTDAETKIYMNSLEIECGGKLNLATLEIEKQPEFKDGDIVCMMDRFDNYRFIFIYRNEDDENFYYHAHITRNGFVNLGENEYLSKPRNYSVHLATDLEKQQLFDALAKKGKAWDAEKKMIVDLKKKVELKPFDKVVVRCSEADRWSIDFFSYKAPNGYICAGDAWFGYCLPYNEETAKLIGTTKDMEV